MLLARPPRSAHPGGWREQQREEGAKEARRRASCPAKGFGGGEERAGEELSVPQHGALLSWCRSEGTEESRGLSSGKSPGKDRSLLEKTRDAGTWPAKGLGVSLGASAASCARNMEREGMEGERGALWGGGGRPGTKKQGGKHRGGGLVSSLSRAPSWDPRALLVRVFCTPKSGNSTNMRFVKRLGTRSTKVPGGNVPQMPVWVCL